MENYLVTFKYEGQLNTLGTHHHNNPEIIKEIIALLRSGGVAMTNWEITHMEELDNPTDLDETILENHTLFEIRLEVDDREGTDEAIDWHDGGDDLFHYVLDALELGEPEITYFYSCGEAPMQKTLLGVDIHTAF